MKKWIWMTCCLMVMGCGTPSKLPTRDGKTYGGDMVPFAVTTGKHVPFHYMETHPHAVIENGIVYCVFQNATGRPFIMSYAIEEQVWTGPVQVSSVGLGDNAHGSPSLCIDHQGYLHIFYGCHDSPLRYTKSTAPHDISSWQEQDSLAPNATYPQAMRPADGSIRLFYVAGGPELPWMMITSFNGGSTWSEPEHIIEMRLDPPDRWAGAYAYFRIGTDGKTIHCFWNHKDNNARLVNRGKIPKHPWRPLKYRNLDEMVYRYNMYYMRGTLDGQWTNATGDPVTPPVTRAEANQHCVVFDSGDEFAYPDRIVIDSRNRPYLKYMTGVKDARATAAEAVVPMRPEYASFSDGTWRLAKRFPPDWPEEALRVVRPWGILAEGDRDYGEWFIFFKPRDPRGWNLFLRNEISGYAAPSTGPVDYDLSLP